MSADRPAKKIVEDWFSAGIFTPAALEMVSEDFVWYAPISLAEIFEDTEAGAQRGKDGLSRLHLLDEALYANISATDGSNSTDVHFIISEGDITVIELDVSFTGHDGDKYKNTYSLTIRTKGGLIAEVKEHIDSLYLWRTLMGTPEKCAGVHERLTRLRADAASA